MEVGYSFTVWLAGVIDWFYTPYIAVTSSLQYAAAYSISAASVSTGLQSTGLESSAALQANWENFFPGNQGCMSG